MPEEFVQDILDDRYSKIMPYIAMDGHCFGFALMAMQAFFVREIDQFETRRKLIKNIKINDFTSILDVAYSDESSRELLLYVFQKQTNLDISYEQCIDIIAFGTRLYFLQDAYSNQEYDDFFEHCQRLTYQQKTFGSLFHLLASDKLKAQGEIIEHGVTSGIYTSEDLNLYIASLRETIQQECKKIEKGSEHSENRLVAMTLLSCDHSILLGYDPDCDNWYIGDANEEEIYITNKHDFAKKIYSLLNSVGSTHVALATKIYTYNNQYQANLLLQWKKNEYYRVIHNIENKINIRGYKRFSWLDIACFFDDYHMVKVVVNENRINPQNGIALHHACYNDNIDCVRELSTCYEILDITDGSGKSALYYAALINAIDIVELLIERGSDVVKEFENPISAISIAAKSGYQNIISSLLDALSDQYPDFKYDLKIADKIVNAAQLAEDNGFADIAKTLRSSIARQNVHEKIIKKLKIEKSPIASMGLYRNTNGRSNEQEISADKPAIRHSNLN